PSTSSSANGAIDGSAQAVTRSAALPARNEPVIVRVEVMSHRALQATCQPIKRESRAVSRDCRLVLVTSKRCCTLETLRLHGRRGEVSSIGGTSFDAEKTAFRR